MLVEIPQTIRKISVKENGRIIDKRPIRIPETHICYLEPETKRFFYQEPKIVDKTKWWSKKSFHIQILLLISKNPHLEFVTFHKYQQDEPQVLFLDTRRKIHIAIKVSDFKTYRSYEPPKRDKSNDVSPDNISCPVPQTQEAIFNKMRELNGL